MRSLFKAFRRDERGVAAIEMAAVGTLFILGAMTATDVGRYAYQTSEVNAAAQAGAQAALVACDLGHTPATLNCSDLTSAVTGAIQTSRLGDLVKLDGQLTEGYYCMDAVGGLQQAGTTSNKPSDCSGVANSAAGAIPTLYLQVPVTYAFKPLFAGLSITQAFPAAIKRTAWMRMA